jgi:dihydrofolate reductase
MNRRRGGANAARQYLITGLVDEIEISLVPILLGSGEQLFDGVGDDLHELQPVESIDLAAVSIRKFDGRSR